ncbi:hypothetical protein HDU79_001462, partial [Rhizoclosmatium sp. JEL0117]
MEANTTTPAMHKRLVSTDGIIAMSNWVRAITTSGDFQRYQEYLELDPSKPAPVLKKKPITSKSDTYDRQTLELDVLNQKLKELNIRKIYAEEQKVCDVELKASKKIKVNLNYAQIPDPNGQPGATINGPTFTLSGIQQKLDLLVAITECESEIKSLKEKHKQEIAILEETQKAEENFNKELEHIQNRHLKALNTIRTSKWMDDYWRETTKNCRSMQELMEMVRVVSRGIDDTDTRSGWRTEYTRIQGTIYEGVNQLFVDFKKLEDGFGIAYPNSPLGSEERREIIRLVVDKLQQALSPMIKDDQVCGYVLSNLMEEVRQNRSQSIVDIPALRAKYTAALAQYVNKRKSMGLEVDEESSSQPSLKQLGPGKPAAKSKGTPTQGPKKPVPPKPTDGRIYTWCPYHFKWEQRKSADKCHFATLCTHIKPTETRNAHERNCPLKESCPCAPKKPTTGSGPRGNPKGQKRGQDDLEKELEMAERRVQQLKDQKNAKHQKINSCKEPEDSLMVLDDDDGSEGKPSPKGHWWASVQQRLNLKELDSAVESEEKNSKSGGSDSQNEVVDVDAMDVDVDEPNCGASMSSAKGVGSTNERTGGTSTTADTGAT